ncbi:MAG: hypothetical protein OEZ13_11340 [Spirochaetia bacterium]|nr:hypothetical protein [Spirochaetia bacterium]
MKKSEKNHKQNLYQIKIKGHLDSNWAGWFDGFQVNTEENGHTLLTGEVADQAALHGLLRKVRNSGMTLLSVNQINLPEAAETKNLKIKKRKGEELK